MIADDLFAGAGGWDLAATQLGIHPRGVENMPEARATREAAGLATIHDDVWTFEPDGKATGLIASPPCQTFSAAGKGSGRKALDDVLRGIREHYFQDLEHLRFLGAEVDDDRTALVLTPLHFAVNGDYEWLAWEQVPTVLPVWEACAELLERYGWHTWTGLLYAEQYGVPQTRKRAFLLASRRGPVAPPTPTHSRYYSRTPDKLDPGVKRWVSMAEALGWDDGAWRFAGAGRTSEQTAGQIPRLPTEPAHTITGKGTAAWIDRPDYLMPTNDRPNVAKRSPDHPAPTMAFGHERPRWCWNRPSTTIVGSFKPEIVAAPGYRTTVSRQNAPDSVRVTVEEAGVLQSFPADFPWQGAKGKQFLQCGNAVPPGLALHALMAASGVETAIDEEVA